MTEVNHTSRGGGAHITVVPSFSVPGKSYLVREGVCNCPAEKKGRGCVKHVALASTLEKIEALPFTDREKGRLSERVLRLAKRIYARPRKDETVRQSYELYLEVLGERYASEPMRAAAHARLHVVQSRYYGDAA